MIRTVRRFGAALTMVAMVVLAPTAASALTSYNGSDYSYDEENRSRITTCDRESDNTKVKAEFQTTAGWSSNVQDTDGNNGNCASRGSVGSVYKHKTCEFRSGWPDACGSWVNY